MTTPGRTHGGLVESTLEAAQTWLRLAAASVKSVALAKEAGWLPVVEAEFHDAAAYRYEEAAQKAERLAEACRIQARYHKEMSRIARGDTISANDGRQPRQGGAPMKGKALTRAQRALLERVRAAGELRLNGRARKPVSALKAAGYVTYAVELRPSAIGKWTEIYIVRPTDKAGP